MIKNGKNQKVNDISGSLPNVASAMNNWFQPMKFSKINKIIVDFNVQETYTIYDFRGVWQQINPQDLTLKPEGQRDWLWYKLHSDTSLELKPDDVIIYECKKYRIMQKIDHKMYGYFEYDLVEDFKRE